MAAFWETEQFTNDIVRNWNLDNFRQVLEQDVYRDVAWRTIQMATLVTVADAVLAFPIAYYMARVASPRTRDVLVVAVMRLSHAALGAMSGRGRGGIINVSSVAAFLPRGSYSAAKAYVNSFGAWASHEYRPQGVTVTTLCPGFTKTEFHERMEVTRGDGFMWLEVDFLVRKSLQDFDKGRAYSIPGAQYKTIIALTKAIPNRVLRLTQSLGRK